MCGIVGYIGKEVAVPYLMDGLNKLEYRGYDSAGVAVIEKGEISVAKTAGRLEKLEALLAAMPALTGGCGIGHTRWATHGEPSDANSHPHLSKSGLFAVVHNGIIENFAVLKKALEKDGFVFSSQTDTEVIAHLLEKNYDGDFLCAVKRTVSLLEGSFALAILCKNEPKKMICTKRSSPLVLGKGKNGCFIASDITALLRHTSDVYKLGDFETAVVSENDIEFFDEHAQLIKKIPEHIAWSVADAEKGGYEHFMLKEIMEQPKALHDTIGPRIKDDKDIFPEGFSLSEKQIKNINKIYIVACGSAYHAGVVGKYVFEKMTRIPTEADIASEFRYRDPTVDENTLVIIISQSGETADTLAALRTAKKKGAKVLSIVNVVGSSIAGESEAVIYTYAGPEIAVATTKAYSAQLSVLYLLCAHIAHILGKISDKELEHFIADIKSLPDKIRKALEMKADIEKISELFQNCEHAYFIGRGLDYAGAMEASLKMKEISYIHCEAYAAGELKHGTISLIENATVVVAICCCDSTFSKTVSNIKEVKARGASVLAVTTEKHKNDLNELEHVIVIPDAAEMMLPSVQVIPMQLLSYYTAKARGCDIDKPRNLAKSVTVE